MKKKSERRKFDRNAAFSMNLVNQNSAEKEAIQNMMNLGDKLICFSEKSISEILTAETIDPKNEKPETRHSYRTIYQIGTENSFVARTIIQAKEILDSVILRQGLEKQKILNHVWACSKLLFNCEESYYKVFAETKELMHECDVIISKHKNSSYIPPLPQVEYLEQHVVAFLGHAKRFLESSYGLLGIFYNSPSFESNFRSYREWMAKNKPDQKKIRHLLEQDKDWIQFISWSRNALDVNHSKPQFKVIIENFKIQKGNKFTNPCWRYDFRATNGGIQNEPSDIIRDMDIHMSNMLTFLEEVFLICIQDNWDCRYDFQIYKRKKNEVNIKCPSVYSVSLKLQQ
ncbi:hypothetical protein ES705_27700 [subsurface metagenome]